MMKVFERASPEGALHYVLLDAARLRPGLQIGYATDLHWLFTLRLQQWVRLQGGGVKDKQPLDAAGCLNPGDVQMFDETPVQYMTGVAAHPVQTIDAAFCMRYGCSDYSWEALNYAHEHRHRGKDIPLLPARHIQPMPMLLGSFSVVMIGRPDAHVPALPGALRCVARAQWPSGKTQFVWAWLGVWMDGDALPSTLMQQIQELPPQPPKPSTEKMGRRYMSWSGCKVVLHYGKPGDDEATLRTALGFKPKGKPISEEILYRSVCEIFGAEAVKRHYRGRELQGLELDIWVPALRLGFEYQGEQHTKQVELWHGKDGLERQQERDKRKKLLCKKLGCRLFFFHPNEWLNKVSVLEKLRLSHIVRPEFE